MSSDGERALRNELEKVQSEVLKLRAALAKPETLHVDARARIAQLRRSKEQQESRLQESLREERKLRDELEQARAEVANLRAVLDEVLRSERVLVDHTVHALDPGPARAGCLSVLMLIGAVFW